MNLSNFLQALLAVCSIAAIVVVGRNNIKKQTIADLQALVLAHEQTITQLKTEGAEKDKRICALEDIIDGYAELVQEGNFPGFSGARSRNRTASSKTSKNRTS